MKCILVIVFVLLSSISIGQINPKIKPETKANEIIRAKDQISSLKSGALLVRLSTKSRAIAALEKKGHITTARQVAADQRELNQTIVNSFNENFNFCSVYFFYSDYSKAIMDSNLSNVVFLNDSLLPDSSITYNGYFLTAEFGITKKDTTSYVGGYYLVPTEKGPERRKDMYTSGKMGVPALIIKSDQFIQLMKPFPYYIRTLETLPFRRKHSKTVRMINEKLHDFYKER